MVFISGKDGNQGNTRNPNHKTVIGKEKMELPTLEGYVHEPGESPVCQARALVIVLRPRKFGCLQTLDLSDSGIKYAELKVLLVVSFPRLAAVSAINLILSKNRVGPRRSGPVGRAGSHRAEADKSIPLNESETGRRGQSLVRGGPSAHLASLDLSLN